MPSTEMKLTVKPDNGIEDAFQEHLRLILLAERLPKIRSPLHEKNV
jgi:hypothetical protein